MLRTNRLLFNVGLGALLSGFTYSVSGADLSIDVEGLRNTTGNVRLAVYDAATAFETSDLTKSVAAVQIRANLHSVSIHGLAPGKYAVAAYHDENQDGALNKGVLLADEGYGFSNGASCWEGPTFDAAAFLLKPETSSIKIQLKYC